ncbi:translation initiation factor IF-2 [Nannocystaceae bacterium ST9]
MAKIRIYELAKELGIEDNKELVAYVRGLGIEVKGVMSTLDDDQAATVRRRFSTPGGAAASNSGGGGGGSKPTRPPEGNSAATSRPSVAKPSAPPAAPTPTAAPIRRRATGVRPAEKEREKEREREEAERSAPEEVRRPVEDVRRPAEPLRRPVEVRRRPESETSRPPTTDAPKPTSTTTPAEVARRSSAPASSSGSASESVHESESQARAAEPPPPREQPQVGERIQLPPGTRRFADGLAAKLEQRRPSEPPPREREPRTLEQDRERESSRVERERDRPLRQRATEAPREVVAAPAGGEARSEGEERKPEAKPVGKRREDDARLVRDADGVIIGTKSKTSGPTIVDFIKLPGGGPAQQRRQQVIITDASKSRSEGRATARKKREEKAQQRGRRRTPVRRRDRGGPKQVSTVEMSEAKKRIRVDEVIQISDLAHQMGVKASKVIRQLWVAGMRNLTINHAIDVETAELVAAEFGYTVENTSFDEDDLLSSYDEEDGVLRAPVVTIMGHVDHGKTTLLDYIRSAKVAEGEAGGITQHIGAYRVETGQGPVVFIDTPGHEAFTAMRSRGAAVTDIVVLIVAADDGVMPTTQEAIKHAQESDVPIIVAINKIDKHDANVGRVEQMLMKEGLVGENYGGETPICHISAKTGAGVDALLELLAVQAEVLELRAPLDGLAAGTVIESRIDKGRGTIATMLVQAGTLRRGDIVVADEFSGKVRDLFTPTGKKIDEATPSTPVEVLGLDGAPPAGDRFYVVENDRDARALVAHRRELRRRRESVRSGPSALERLKSRRTPILKIVLKADVQGSAEALRETLEDLSTDKVRIEVIADGVGGINETDVKMAAAADNPLIVGFNVKTVGKATQLAEQEKVPIEYFTIIYEAADRIRERMIDLLEPEYREVELGQAEVRALFPIPRLGVVAGCRVIRGSVTRTSHVRVRRGDAILHSGKISSLRVFKDDVREVKEGQECGIVVAEFTDVQPGDVLEAFELETIRPEL